MPRRITIVDQLPKGITGKVQRKRLSDALREKPQQGGRSEEGLTDKLTALFKRVLKTDDLSPDDDFFEKGGDSLLAMDVSLELQKMIGKELPESLLFEAPTVRDLAKRLVRGNGVKDTILLTGATGALGSMLLQRLSDQGYEVICLVRGKTRAKRASEFAISSASAQTSRSFAATSPSRAAASATSIASICSAA